MQWSVEKPRAAAYFFLIFAGLQIFFFLSDVAPHDLHRNLPGRSHSFGLSSRQLTATPLRKTPEQHSLRYFRKIECSGSAFCGACSVGSFVTMERTGGFADAGGGAGNSSRTAGFAAA